MLVQTILLKPTHYFLPDKDLLKLLQYADLKEVTNSMQFYLAAKWVGTFAGLDYWTYPNCLLDSPKLPYNAVFLCIGQRLSMLI